MFSGCDQALTLSWVINRSSSLLAVVTVSYRCQNEMTSYSLEMRYDADLP